MKYLHTMVRVSDLDAALNFYCNLLGLVEVRRYDNEAGRFSLIFLGAPDNPEVHVELTHNWDPEALAGGRNFGHLAYQVEDIYAACQRFIDGGVTINRHRVMAGWLSSARQTGYRSSCFRKAIRYHRRSPGRACKTPVSGSRPRCTPTGFQSQRLEGSKS